MKATMKDVAALAEVGVGTVSRVINGVKVKDKTYEKVMRAIEELDYKPDEYARGLKTNRSNTIALILPTIWHPFFAEFAYHIEERLSRKGYRLFLCNADGSAEKENEYIEMVKQSKVDGIIGITYSDIDKYISSDLPFVSIDRHFSEQISYVTADNYLGGQIAAQELIDRGCRNLCYIGGVSPFPNETNNRKAGYYNVCKENGIPVKVLDMVEPIQELEQQLEPFLKNNPEIDGIFSVNDFMALDVIGVMKKLGRKAPDDYQIIGFDGVKLSKERDYLISTIVQPIEEMARASVDTMMAMILKKEEPKRVVIPVSFYQGETTKEKNR
ncbi:LacI family transcriptional regulator [Aequitasia blattaphilus]|uniref:LacI family DNA-binding transcriptional regulator n=1 Tax=Aequitasia blattaphilus TaxID=2949332 RepID=A0ABT1E9U3_9FIRM|nr:LacI family DNA-binding transcriptional regulator [Aequitasia blattaphilus]MCP1101747.1 LacI family DNA-binding transcriptional regulator [Aequitasia blattaphilus]MCR8614387.1 LacI family DNA-binding transcriptional regulator [Aequitasia blattaphilus]